MNKKTVIIIPNELTTNIKEFYCRCDELHIEGISKFIYQNDLSISSQMLRNSDKVSKELADQGFIVVLIDEFYNEENIKNLVILLPKEISPNQMEYFKTRKEYLQNYNLMILVKVENEKFKFIDQTTTSNPLIDELMEILSNRLIKVNKKKILKPKDKN